MVLQCIVCGIAQDAPPWDIFSEVLKSHPEHAHAYVCESCRVRLQADAQREGHSS